MSCPTCITQQERKAAAKAKRNARSNRTQEEKDAADAFKNLTQKEKKRIYNARYIAKNSEKVRRQQRESYARHREARKAKVSLYYHQNKERILARQRAAYKDKKSCDSQSDNLSNL